MVAVKFLPSADNAVIVEFGDRIDRAISDQVLGLAARLRASEIAGVIEVVPTFRSLMVHYDPLRTSAREIIGAIERVSTNETAPNRKRRLWRVPVCYERGFAPDLESVARETRLAPPQSKPTPGAPTWGSRKALPWPGRRVSGASPVCPRSICLASNRARAST